MSEAYVEVKLTTSAPELADLALEKLKEELEARGIIGWQPNDGNLEIIEIGAISPLAANAAVVASVVPPAIFRRFGTELIGLPYREGANAICKTTWRLLEENGEYPARTIEAGTALTIGELAFYVENDVNVAKGESTATVQLIAAERGTAFNGLTGTLQPVDAINWVSEVTIVGESFGGVNQEEDAEYLDRLAAYLKLQAPRPITAGNFAEFVLDSDIENVEVQRATCIDGYNPEETAFEGRPKKAGNELTEVTSFAGISAESTGGVQKHPGTIIKGTDIPEGTTVVSVNEGSKKIVLSAEPTGEPGKESLKAIGSYLNERTVTVFVYFKGEALGLTETERLSTTKTKREAIVAYLEKYREINFKIFCMPASFTKVYATAKIHCLPNYNTATVEANVKAAIVGYLSAETWANPESASTGSNSWLNATQGYNVVRYNQIIGVIEKVQGVDYVFSGSGGLKIGTTATPTGTADIILPGPAPLPACLTEYVLVSSE